MAIRPPESQNLHDQVIGFVRDSLSSKYEVYTNPGTNKDWSIKGEFPDILLATKETKQIKFVIEVETADSVTPEEARNQWKAYAGLPGAFYILVPQESLPLARQIVAGQGIQARIGYYTIDQSGEVLNVEYDTE